MVVLALIGFLIAMVTPRLTRRSLSSEWKNITADLNNLALFVRQESVAEQRPFRLHFVRGKNNGVDAVIAERFDRVDQKGNRFFEKVVSPYFRADYEFPRDVKIRAIFLGKQELFRESSDACCYVVPDGLVQHVFVQLYRIDSKQEDAVTLKMLPVECQFELVEKQVRPGQENL